MGAVTKIIWDYEWLSANKNRFTVIKDFYKAYCEETNSQVSYRSFNRCTKRIGFENPTRVGRVFHKWDDEWILKNWDAHHYLTSLYEAYIKYMEIDKSTLDYKSFCQHCKRKLNVRNNSDFTEEEIEWIKENYQTYGFYGCEEPFRKRFGGYHTWQSISKKAQKMGIFVNKEDIRMKQSEAKIVPLGTISIDTRGNHIIKTEDDWKPLHRHVWEQHYGKIDKDDRVIFLDKNKNNISIENLACIPKGHVSTMVRLNMFSENPYITKTAIKWVELYKILKEQENLEKENSIINR